ncbi:unnamed protein product [Hermetia illucens]|uniref:SCP domain-containing protein n=1 Tax=Hermetia illucens TaxID=343691 RepID=A0A7R8Z509_HERIL|nr:unnamed protein product [Hermetia illucens]
MKVEVRLLLLLASLIISANAANYCDSSLCPSGQHIACGNNGKFGAQCPAGAKVVDLSGGNLPGYQQARRMGTVQWDDELAKIALLNAKRCFMAHDACRNIPRFTRSGQNIALSSTKGMPNQLRKHLIEAIQNWFLEYKDGNMNIMNSFRDPKVVGHFTVMVSDRLVKVGCGTVRFTKNGRDTLLTTCNYSTTNILNKPVYKTGTAASGCTSGKNPTYKNLCSVNEPINPNAI